MDPDSALNGDVQVMKTFYPHTMCGFDKLNRPILWEMDGKINAQALATMATKEGLLGYHFWTMQTKLDNQFTTGRDRSPLPSTWTDRGSVAGGGGGGDPSEEDVNGGSRSSSSSSNSTGKKEGGALPTVFTEVEGLDGASGEKGEKQDNGGGGGSGSSNNSSTNSSRNEYSSNPINTIAVMDMTDFGMEQCSKMCLDQVKQFISTDNVCYPETLGKMLVINAPWLATSTWGVVKRWLDVRTVNKIEILSPEESLARLREFIDEDNLPAQYGGKGPELYQPHPHCEFAWIGRGGEVTRGIHVPAGMHLTVDSYVSEGTVECSIVSAVATAASSSKKRDAFTFKVGDGAKLILDRAPIVPKEGQSERLLKKIALDSTSTPNAAAAAAAAADGTSADAGHEVVVTWKNTSRFHQRPLVYAFTPFDPAAEQAASKLS
jgi:hypothetical protein